MAPREHGQNTVAISLTPGAGTTPLDGCPISLRDRKLMLETNSTEKNVVMKLLQESISAVDVVGLRQLGCSNLGGFHVAM